MPVNGSRSNGTRSTIPEMTLDSSRLMRDLCRRVLTISPALAFVGLPRKAPEVMPAELWTEHALASDTR